MHDTPRTLTGTAIDHAGHSAHGLRSSAGQLYSLKCPSSSGGCVRRLTCTCGLSAKPVKGRPRTHKEVAIVQQYHVVDPVHGKVQHMHARQGDVEQTLERG